MANPKEVDAKFLLECTAEVLFSAAVGGVVGFLIALCVLWAATLVAVVVELMFQNTATIEVITVVAAVVGGFIGVLVSLRDILSKTG